ncbi:hypothetical protein FRB94_002479 [Tulasnella sp. JGI-2019a]|nr:hypothetical protein FRB93_003986 [Tulasnella sp. JGI-2019a]KAG9004259.1 hypothetical protein FRB94_002479 [Tulasnella sp. JGI-2019a]KAG9032460.1 hypothetical protein FRB95_001435 [Tulasnella sp. JGI-2019a]
MNAGVRSWKTRLYSPLPALIRRNFNLEGEMVDLKTRDVDRLFIQALMTRRVVSEDLAQQLFKKSKAAVLSVDQHVQGLQDLNWPAFLTRVKASLDVLDLNIAKIMDEETGKGVFALVNTVGDEVSKLATEYPTDHIIYFRQIVEQIMTAPRQAFSISSMAALKEATSLPEGTKKISGIQAQLLLNSFVARGWLCKSPRGRYSLAARSLMELRKYLTDTFDEESLFKCTSCDGFVLKGLRCKGREGRCKHKIHKPCFERLGANGRKCPTCGEAWPNQGVLGAVGEDAVRDGDKETRRKIQREGSQEDEQDDDDQEEQREDVDMDPNGMEGPSQKGKKKQKNVENKPKKAGKKSTRKKVRDEEDDDNEEEAAESQDEGEDEEPPMDEDSDEPSKARKKGGR